MASHFRKLAGIGQGLAQFAVARYQMLLFSGVVRIFGCELF